MWTKWLLRDIEGDYHIIGYMGINKAKKKKTMAKQFNSLIFIFFFFKKIIISLNNGF